MKDMKFVEVLGLVMAYDGTITEMKDNGNRRLTSTSDWQYHVEVEFEVEEDYAYEVIRMNVWPDGDIDTAYMDYVIIDEDEDEDWVEETEETVEVHTIEEVEAFIKKHEA